MGTWNRASLARRTDKDVGMRGSGCILEYKTRGTIEMRGSGHSARKTHRLFTTKHSKVHTNLIDALKNPSENNINS